MAAIRQHPDSKVSPVSNRPENRSHSMQQAPVEILRTIFSLVVSTKAEDDLNNPYSILSSPNISGVNTMSYIHWRGVALNFTDLWTTIHIMWPGRQTFRLIQLWLLRSKTKLLTFSLHQGHSDDSVSTTLAVFGQLMDQATRWKSVEFDIDNSIGMQFINGTVPPPPKLEEIKVMIRKRRDVGSSWRLSSFLHSSPRLYTVLWDNTEVPLSFHRMAWMNVRSLTLYATQYPSELLIMLGQCNRLEALTIHHQNKYQDPQTFPAVCLPSLQTFSVGDVLQMDILFSRMTLPALAKLRFLHGWHGDLSQTWDGIQDLIIRSSCTLKFLGIEKLKQTEDTHIHIRNFKAPCLDLLDTLQLGFHQTSSTIHFTKHDAKNQKTLVRIQEDGRCKLCIYISKGADDKIKPFDIGCAVRYAFAFDIECTSN
ncbi:hypothetical protein HYPSUDRAFT_46199 [Hypholoma sublateritium FD-334 SS-4]|uniref:F-box domain-containing protein n=1 Tax=Hypholoma sublateritium (strain FD-334 SS-4) TaxID=945553 RepID=A0A0D2NEX5_HYPSF|nr:hypothetical protein HYPSUDRAFT_46199 [Hypholoma sublateritium FD-334 SS-4]